MKASRETLTLSIVNTPQFTDRLPDWTCRDIAAGTFEGFALRSLSSSFIQIFAQFAVPAYFFLSSVSPDTLPLSALVGQLTVIMRFLVN